MRREKRWRYYCGFCKKSGGSAGHMRRHESACTMNPDRKCRMCALLESEVTYSVAELIEAAECGGLSALREKASGCAACMLAAIRQARASIPIDEAGTHFDCWFWSREVMGWSYADEKKSFWDEVNEDRALSGPYY